MKLLSFNICHGGRPLSAVLQFLKQEEPDFALLQEVYDGKDKRLEENFRSLPVIREKLKFKFFAFGVTHNIFYKNCLISSGNLTLTKHQIVNSSFIFFTQNIDKPPTFEFKNFASWLAKGDYSFVPKGMLLTEIKVKNKILLVINLHGPWGEYGGDSDVRDAMIEKILGKIKDNQNVIIAGDFNMNPQTKAIRRLEKRLINVFKGKLKTTFNFLQKPQAKNWKRSIVDMIFIGKNIKINQAFCPTINASDHLPLVLDFDFPLDC